MGSDWYPTREDELIAWHSAFAAGVAAYAAALGIAAPVVAQVQQDAATVASVLTYLEQAKNFASEVVAFKTQVLRGDLNTPNPPLPNPPAALTLGLGWQANIEARTRQLAAQIKANTAYTTQMGEDMGIEPTGGAVALSVRAVARPNHRVDVRVTRGGYPAAALDSRRNGGPWEQIAVLVNATWEDTRPPLVPGQPETREYRAQGYQGNARVGDVSETVAVVTEP